MKHLPTRLFVFLLATLFTALLLRSVSPILPRASAAPGSCAWHKVLSPSIGGVLWGVSAITHTDAWAVGSNGGSGIAEHWDGTRWSVVSSPNVGTFTNGLGAVTAFSSSDIWAVGLYWAPPGTITDTLTEHWDGSTWNVVSSPNPPGWPPMEHGSQFWQDFLGSEPDHSPELARYVGRRSIDPHADHALWLAALSGIIFPPGEQTLRVGDDEDVGYSRGCRTSGPGTTFHWPHWNGEVGMVLACTVRVARTARSATSIQARRMVFR